MKFVHYLEVNWTAQSRSAHRVTPRTTVGGQVPMLLQAAHPLHCLVRPPHIMTKGVRLLLRAI